MQEEEDQKGQVEQHDRLFPDLAPYGKARPLPAPKPPMEPEAKEVKAPTPVDRTVYDKRLRISKKFASPVHMTEPVATPNIAPNVPIATPIPTAKRRWLKRKLLIASSLTLLATLLVGGFVAWSHFLKQHNSSKSPSNSASQTPQALFAIDQKLLGFPLYIPLKLPSGFKIDTSSMKTSDNLLNFYIRDGDGSAIVVTEQKKTPDFVSPKNSGPKQTGILNPVTFNTASGEVSMFQENNNSIGLLETTSTLVICNVNIIRSADAEGILRSFVSL